MKENTKFPEAYYIDSDYPQYVPIEVHDWFQRCLTDFPNVMEILEAKQNIGISRTFQALLLVCMWRAKWFDQFEIDCEHSDAMYEPLNLNVEQCKRCGHIRVMR